MSTERSPSLAAVINDAMRLYARGLRVSMPGVIDSFDSATQLCGVKPQLKESVRRPDGTSATETLPVIPGVPVQFMAAGGFLSTMPPAKGDPCWIFFGDRSLDLWISRGGDVLPDDTRAHDLNDAIVIMGVRPEPKALSEFDTSRAVFGKTGGPRVAVSDDFVHLGVSHGENAAHFAAFADKCMDNFNALKNSINALVQTFGSHTHTVSTAGSPVAHTGTTMPPSTPAQQAQAPVEVAAAKVKVK